MVISLAIALTRQGFQVVVVALDHGGEHEHALRDAGICYHILGGRRLAAPRYHLVLAGLFRGAQVVHTHHFSPLLNAMAAAKLARVPRLVHTEHSYQYLELRRDYRFVLRFISRQCDAFVVVGRAMEPYYREQVKVPGNRLRVVPNGVALDRFRPARDIAVLRRSLGLGDGVLIGTAGRFDPVKRYHDLLQAMARVRALRPGVRLLLIGDGPERSRLERMTAELDLTECVVFPGWQKDLTTWMSALDVFVLPSESEGLPCAVLEAMAAGVPVVATPVGDLPHVVIEGESGFLVPIGDIRALADALVRLVDDEALRQRFGRFSRESVMKRYSEQSMVDRYTEIYDL